MDIVKIYNALDLFSKVIADPHKVAIALFSAIMIAVVIGIITKNKWLTNFSAIGVFAGVLLW